MTKISVRQVAQLKRTAQNVYPLVNAKNKLIAKIVELNAELESTNAQIESWEGATKIMTGGFTSEDLITRTVSIAVDENGNTKLDKAGMPVKVTKYEPKKGVLVLTEDGMYEIIPEVTEEVSSTEVDYDATVDEQKTSNALESFGITSDED